MTTLNLRPDFLLANGPGDFRMPSDPEPAPGIDWVNPPAGVTLYHEDFEDRRNPDGSWGGDPWGYGGSGLNHGYSSPDLAAVLVAEQGTWIRKVRYDWDHWIRQIRYAIAAWEMTHDPKFARRIVAYDNIATGQWTDDPATIHLNDPGWIPWTLAQMHAMAQQKPGTGIPPLLRPLAWVGYGKLMRLKIDRRALRAWPEMLLETCALAAQPGTGQISSGLTSTFHEALLLHTILCACHRLKVSVPDWAFVLMNTIQTLPRMNYPEGPYGMPSPIRFWRTIDGAAVPDAPDGQPQQGDPAMAYWSTNCVAMHKLDPLGGWLDKATLIGPTTFTDQNTRKLTMLYRGALAA